MPVAPLLDFWFCYESSDKVQVSDTSTARATPTPTFLLRTTDSEYCMETIFGLPTIALRNVPESVIAKLHQVTAVSGTASAATYSSTSPLAVLDGTKIVSRLHLGAAVRKAILAANPAAGKTVNSSASTALDAASAAARPVSPTRLQSPNRRRSAASQDDSASVPSSTASAVTAATITKLSSSSTVDAAAAATTVPASATTSASRQQLHGPRIASQLVYHLSPNRSTAIRNFALPAPPPPAPADAQKQQHHGSFLHRSAVVVIDSDISPAEAWKWVKSAGAMEMVVSLSTLQATLNPDAICTIYGLDSIVSGSVAGGSAAEKSNVAGHAILTNSNMPGKVPARDVSWLEKQVVCKVATANL